MEEFDDSARKDLRRLCTFPKKKLGQNFLQNKADLEVIAAALHIHAGEQVLEIGPGLGALTEVLLGLGASVIGVEKDRAMVFHLKQKYPSHPLSILESDILTIRIPEDVPLNAPLKVVGNIPYNITSPIIFWLIDQHPHVSEAVLTVQKEVAERLCATPGGKIWGALSVMVQAQADVEIIRKIPRAHFYPAPNVDSAVIHLRMLDKPRFAPATRKAFSYWVSRAFQKRRKMLPNSIENEELGWTKEKIGLGLSKLGIDPKRRPETLSVVEWSRLASSFGNPLNS